MNINTNFLGDAKNIFSLSRTGMLKSTKEKLMRQQEMQNQIDFFEQQKENLKSMECGNIDEIARKLDLFHSYEDQIAAAKQSYNQQQMFHVMDEAKERGEQIAKEAEKNAPKDAEERKEDLQKEALGMNETSALDDVMETLSDSAEELTQTAEAMTQEVEQNTENLTDMVEQTTENAIENQKVEDAIPAKDTALLAQRTFVEKRVRESVDLYV